YREDSSAASHATRARTVRWSLVRRSFTLWPVWGSIGLMVACGVGARPEGQPSALVSVDGAPLGRLSVVPRLLLRAAISASPQDYWLVSGRLNDKELSQVLVGVPSAKVRD